MLRNKKKVNKYLLLVLLLGISVGFALMSTTLKINGIAGVKSTEFDIHWENVVPNQNSTVQATTPTISENATKVTYEVPLDLPGDFYEFTVDAKNDGDVNGIISNIDHSIYLVNPQTGAKINDPVPDYIISTVIYDDTEEEPALNDILEVNAKQTYRIRVEYDPESEELPENDIVIQAEDEITYIQTKDDPTNHLISFNPNGGTVSPTAKSVVDEEAIGEMPTPTIANADFEGWYTLIDGGIEVTEETVPTSSATIFAHWAPYLPTFASGQTVNAKFKELAGNTGATYSTADTNITAIVRSQTAPDESLQTAEHEVQDPNSPGKIYAWYNNGTIYWWSGSEKEYLNEDASYMFYNLKSLTSVDTNFDTRKATSMASLFSSDTSLQTLNLSTFNTSNVTNMSGMFASDSALTTLNVSKFDTSSVTNMNGMFSGVSSLTTLNLSNFDTSHVSDMSGMFNGMSSLASLDLSSFNTSSVTSMPGMFGGASSLTTLDLSNFDTSHTSNMGGMFSGMTSLETLNISNFDFTYSNPSSLMNYLSGGGFAALETLIMDNVVFPTNMSGGLSGLTTVETMSFDESDTSHVTNMSGMFAGSSSVTELDLSSWDTSNVTNMAGMFSSMSSITTIIVSDDFVVEQVSSSSGMFGGSTNIVGGAGTVYDSNHLDKAYAHYDYGSGNPGYFNEDEAVTKYTITFNPNGGTVSPTTKTVYEGYPVGTMPEAQKQNAYFKGWYTSASGGTRITSDTVLTENKTVYAHWYDPVGITYNANGGEFSNSSSTKTINYTYGAAVQTRYSHTPNIDDTGVANGTYTSNMDRNDVVTIPGASTLNVEIWFSTEYYTTDYVSIYAAGITPSTSNYNQAVAARLGGGYGYTKENATHITLTVPGDTAQFFFHSDYSSEYYGYYAIVTGTGVGYSGDAEYEEPTRTDYKFTGWNTAIDGTGLSYKNENEIINAIENDEIADNTPIYAQWLEVYTITFNPNGGTVSEPTRKVTQGDAIGPLPVPENPGYSNTGWYLRNGTTIKIDKNYVPTASKTVEADWNEIETMFDTGANVNMKLKSLAGMSSPSPTTSDTNVTAIVRSNAAPPEGVTTENLEEPNKGYTPIVAWFSNGILYWYTEADTVYTNPNASYMFNAFTNAAQIDTTSFDTSETTNMSWMLGQSGAQTFDLSGFNTSKVTDMSYMFYWSQNLVSLDLSGFDTSNVTNMNSMIGNMSTLVDINISNFDFTKESRFFSSGQGWLISYLTSGTYTNIRRLILDNAIFPENMNYAFAYLSSIQEFSVKNVDSTRTKTMQDMFYYSTGFTYLDLTDFDTSNVTDMSYMFYGCNNLRGVNLSTWNTSKVTTMYQMFYYCNKMVSLDISNFDISNTSNMQYMLYWMDGLEFLNMSNLDFSNKSGMFNYISKPENLKYLFLDNVKFPQNMNNGIGDFRKLEYISLHNVDTSKTTNMSYMLYDLYKIKQLDLTSFDTRNVTNMERMLSYNYELTTIIVGDKFKVGQVTSSNNMFSNSTKIVGGRGTTYDSNHIDKAYAHYDGGSTNPGYFNEGDGINTYYTVTFNANGGYTPLAQITVKAGDSIGYLPTPTKNNSTFEVWRLGTTEGIAVTADFVPTSDITLTADWRLNTKHTVTFDANDGIVTETTREVYEGEKIGTLPVPTRTDYSFAGWHLGTTDGIRVNDSYIVTEDITLVARWKLNKVIIYDATPATYGNDEHTRSVNYTFDSSTSKYVGPTYIEPRYTGYGFLGWTRNSDGSGTVYSESDIADDLDTISSNTTFYAKWRKLAEYTITFNPNGGTMNETTMTAYEDTQIGILPTPTRYNRYFQGWYTGLTDGTKITNSYIPTGDMTLYAHWVYDSNACWRFDNDSWDTIMTHLVEDPTTYPLGCTKEVNMGSLGTNKVRLANTSTPNECSQSGFSQTGCGFVLDFYNVISRHTMNNSNTNVGSWESSGMREYVNTTVYNSLPQDLKKYIMPTKVVTGHGSSDSNNSTTRDKLYILSGKEIFNVGDGIDTAFDKTRQLDYFDYIAVQYGTCSGARTAYKPYQNTNTPESYWLRTPYISNNRYWYDSTGCTYAIGSATNYFGVSPAFRINVRNGWYYENEDTWNPQTDEFKDQKWQYYENGVRIESGVHNLIAAYDGSGQTRHKFLFVDGYMYVGWYTDETTGNKYFYSWFDRDHNGYVEGHRLEGIDDIEIDGVHYEFDTNGVATVKSN